MMDETEITLDDLAAMTARGFDELQEYVDVRFSAQQRDIQEIKVIVSRIEQNKTYTDYSNA